MIVVWAIDRRRHRMAANRYQASRAIAFKVWQQETCAKLLA
jgi:hypothetical protein